MREQRRFNEREVVRELVYKHEPTQAFGDGDQEFSCLLLSVNGCGFWSKMLKDIKETHT
jgi:hypothetical protein